MTDHDLLAQFARTRSQDAFAQLVRRHIDWLHSAALRLVRDPALAQDVTQAVFLVLAQKAPTFLPATPLAPWLFRVLQYVASNARRAETRRKNHESEAAAMRASTISPQETPDWSDVAPLLEPAVAQLPAPDRAAILLRFYQQLSLPDVGTALGVTEEAARKRVTRAVDRLRLLLARKRAAKTLLPAAVLAALLLTHTAHAAPAALTSAAAGLSTGAASATVLSLAKGALAMLLRTQFQLMAACAAGLLLVGVLGIALAQSVAGQSAPSATVSATTPPAAATAPLAGNVNPLFAAWKGQEKKAVTFTRQETISGGAPPVPGQAAPSPATSIVTCFIYEWAADHAAIRVIRGPDPIQSDLLTIPAAFAANDPAAPKPAGTENLKIGDKTYNCTKYTYTSSNPVEIGRDPQGLRARVTVWLADDVPGGVVQRKISLTIRASYDITDVLSEITTPSRGSIAGAGPAAGVVASATATALAPSPAQAVPFDQYEGYFVVNTFEPNNPRSFVVCKDQAAFDNIFHMAVVMGDRSHRLPAGIFERSLVVAPVKRGAFTSFSQISATLQDGILTVRYTARQDPPGSATFTTPLILSVPKAGVKTVVFFENGAKVAEKQLNP